MKATAGSAAVALEKDITFSNLGVVGKGAWNVPCVSFQFLIPNQLLYYCQPMHALIHAGSFGVVFKTSLVDSDQAERVVALKKVLQDRRYKVSR